MKRPTLILTAFVLLVVTAAPALAAAPSRVRELSCSDGTTFTGEQVRMGGGTPPRTFRNVNPGDEPIAFVFFAADVISPTGVVVEAATWDHSWGVDVNAELITCSFIIPIGALTGYTANFYGVFLPA